MKGLNKIALVAAIAAATSAQAELVAMDDAAMGAATGQAGLTIDVNSAEIAVGEVAYKDQGFVVMSDIAITGAADASGVYTALDDIRIFVDVAGAAGNLDLGTGTLGATYLTGNGFTVNNQQADALDPTAPLTAYDDSVAIGDGDLVVAIRGQNGLVDYGVRIGRVDLAEEGYGAELGDIDAATGQTTTLVSGLALNGLVGPVDVVVHNDGGTSETMDINAYFNVGGVPGAYAPSTINVEFMKTAFDLEIHNRRGDSTITGPGGASFAHVQATVGAFENTVNGTEGLAVNVKDFSGDIDVTNIRMGSLTNPSIGDLYITDLRVKAGLEIYGH